jgi:hypothetical protein
VRVVEQYSSGKHLVHRDSGNVAAKPRELLKLRREDTGSVSVGHNTVIFSVQLKEARTWQGFRLQEMCWCDTSVNIYQAARCHVPKYSRAPVSTHSASTVSVTRDLPWPEKIGKLKK